MILCSDAHRSYQKFAREHQLEHRVLKGTIKQRVQHGIYHIQYVNSVHNRVKKWLSGTFLGGVDQILAGDVLDNYPMFFLTHCLNCMS